MAAGGVNGPSGRLRICLLSPWYGGSHKRWADELTRHSRHAIDILELPAVHWKWRMHGAAVTLANRLLESGESYDLILAEDMMDVAVFAGLIRTKGIRVPIATYFHENQISYPVSPRDTDVREKREVRYGFINYTSALVSDRVYFNSHYHMESFLGGLPEFLSVYPDHANLESLDDLRRKAEVLPLGMDLEALDSCKENKNTNAVPLILWNHRREHDKCPEEFLHILDRLEERGLPFEVALMGRQSMSTQALFKEARQRLGRRIIHDGQVRDFRDYGRWLWRADLHPVTARQDFFGGSVVEAAYCGCHPVLPERLAYPEHFPGRPVFYKTLDDAVRVTAALIESGEWRSPSPCRQDVVRYSWTRLASEYDDSLHRLWAAKFL